MRPEGFPHLSGGDRLRLIALVEDPHTSRRTAQRAEIILMAARGCGAAEIRWRTGAHKDVVERWTRRFREAGLEGLFASDPWLKGRLSVSELRDRFRAVCSDEDPKSGEASKLVEFGHAVVGEIWKSHGMRLPLSPALVVSSDPDLVPKVRRILGLYLQPPPNSVVISLDEKGQIPARPRPPSAWTDPEFGRPTTTLYAALNVHDGTVFARCMQRQRHGELIRVLNALQVSIPPATTVHLIMDNFAPHRHAAVARWFGRHPRFQLHHTPTQTSWLNAVEVVLRKMSQNCLKGHQFRSVIELQIAAKEFVAGLNADLRQFPCRPAQ